MNLLFFFFSSRRRHTRFDCDWSSDVCSSDLRELSLIVLAADLLCAPALLQACAEIAILGRERLEAAHVRIRNAECGARNGLGRHMCGRPFFDVTHEFRRWGPRAEERPAPPPPEGG